MLTRPAFPDTWDLDVLFLGGSSSAGLARLLRELQEEIERLVPPAGEVIDAAAIARWQRCSARLDEAGSFAECLAAQDTTDTGAQQLLGVVDELAAELKAAEVDLDQALLQLREQDFTSLVAQPALQPVALVLAERRELAAAKLPVEQERLIERLASDGYHAWNRLYDQMAGALRADMAGGERLSMGQLVHRLEDQRADVRRDAQQLLESSWEQVEEQAAMALNHQAGFRLSTYRARGWTSVLDEPLRGNRLQRQTLEAMWDAVARGAETLVPYLRRKGQLLGSQGVYWYDQFAPMGRLRRQFSFPDAQQYIVDRFGDFSRDLAEFTCHAFEQRWIEAEDRSGKAAGGFCTDFPVSKQTRIFMTFGGTFGGVSTLAHELGHAYHSWLLRDELHFRTRYPMTLAETASTFCEALITDAALERANDKAERLALLGSVADEAVTMMMNLRCRFLFEIEFYQRRGAGPLQPAELSELMVSAQQHAFCGTLAEDGTHPRFWASKQHFYFTDAPFYNFPYVFGYLFSSGIYARARQEGPAFASRYVELLLDTGAMSCEEVAARHLGVDLGSSEFWDEAVAGVLQLLPQVMELAG